MNFIRYIICYALLLFHPMMCLDTAKNEPGCGRQGVSDIPNFCNYKGGNKHVERGYLKGNHPIYKIVIPVLAKKLVNFFVKENAKSVIDVGAGTGYYTRALNQAGVPTTCYDGNPDTPEITEGLCGVRDFTTPVHLPKHDWAFSLHVGMAFADKYTSTFVSNLDAVVEKGIVIVWGSQPKGRSRNFKSNDKVISLFTKMGYVHDADAIDVQGRRCQTCKYLLVFRKSE